MVNTATIVVAAVGWILIGLLSGSWMARRGFDALWILLAAPLGPLFVPIAIERVRRRPDNADATPPESLPAGTGPQILIGVDGSPESVHAMTTALRTLGSPGSALVLADADDATSIRAAELVGAGDAVTAAQGLAREAESDFLQLLRHAANIALPFSDRTSRRITRQRNRFERVDELARCCEDPDTLARKGGKRGDGEDGANGDHARLDVAWD